MIRKLFTGLIVVAAAGFGCAAFALLTLPDVRVLRTTNPATTAFIELRQREAESGGKKPRRLQTWVPYERISSHLKRAVLVTEDAAFFQHDGIDIEELKKSLELNWKKGQFLRGGSTITQQLAKNLYLSPSKNPVRKFREFLIARRLEAELSKRRIFEIYLNVIEWGDGLYGAEAAARQYFRVPAASLGPEQSAMLASMIFNPRKYNPAQPTPFLQKRQQLILSRMGTVTPPPA
ncbi:MAG: monofunctional biosynthetic peptidoglycan transglycosylase, partial [Acidobacteriota bacterium]